MVPLVLQALDTARPSTRYSQYQTQGYKEKMKRFIDAMEGVMDDLDEI